MKKRKLRPGLRRAGNVSAACRLFFLGTLLILAWSLSGIGLAEEDEQDDTKPKQPVPAAEASQEEESSDQDLEKKPPKKEKTRTHYQMGEIEIIGEFERPRTMFIIPKGKSWVEQFPLEKNFDDQIMEPVNKTEFERKTLIFVK